MSVYIGTTTTRAFETQHVMSLAGTNLAGSYYSVVEGQPADIGRNILVDRFLSLGRHDYLLFVDSDATWHPDAIQRLESRGLPFVSSIFFKRDIPPVPTLGIDAGVNAKGNICYDFGYTIRHILEHVKRAGIDNDPKVNNELCLPTSDKDLIPIDGSGAHFIMVRKDVLQAIKGPWFKNLTVSAGEDFYFCRQVKAAGFKLYADLSVYTGHIVGPGVNFGLRQFQMFYHGTNEFKHGEDVWAVR